MTSIEFNLLGLDKKERLVKNFGQLIDKKYSKSNTRIYVYTLADFYVQVSERFNNQIQFIKAIDEEIISTTENTLFKIFLN
jgi:hypothetical protein